jgi:hypothetical protein
MSAEAKEPKKDRRRNAGGLFIPAGLFIGMGIGWALGHLVQGMFVGLGVGFLLFALITLTARD